MRGYTEGYGQIKKVKLVTTTMAKKIKSNSKKYPTKEGGKRAGYVYVAYHPSFKGYAKIGSTNNLIKRASSFNTSYPDDKFEFKYYYWTSNRIPAETEAQDLAGKKYTRATGEWFKIPCSQAGKIIKRMANKYKIAKSSRKK
tara:strand:- start:82 stop:507 length:426 start_codon:yes stop_codon:yes gene_type:complete